MKLLFLILMTTVFAACNDSAKGTRPPEDNTVLKDTTVKDTSIIEE